VTIDLPCSHRTYIHHTAGRQNGRLIWVCSACACQGTLSRQWATFAPFPCHRCHKPIIERVLCPECAKLSRGMGEK